MRVGSCIKVTMFIHKKKLNNVKEENDSEMKIRRKRLQKGDTIGSVSPSRPPGRDELERSLQFIEERGLKWKFGQHAKNINGYLARTDEERGEDIETLFQ